MGLPLLEANGRIANHYRMKAVRILFKNNITFVKIVFANAKKVVIFASASEARICVGLAALLEKWQSGRLRQS